MAETKKALVESNSQGVVRDIITKLTDMLPSAFKRTLIDSELNDPRPNVIVLLNDKEISVLNGLDTEVRDGDKLVLIPVSHGG